MPSVSNLEMEEQANEQLRTFEIKRLIMYWQDGEYIPGVEYFTIKAKDFDDAEITAKSVNGEVISEIENI